MSNEYFLECNLIEYIYIYILKLNCKIKSSSQTTSIPISFVQHLMSFKIFGSNLFLFYWKTIILFYITLIFVCSFFNILVLNTHLYTPKHLSVYFYINLCCRCNILTFCVSRNNKLGFVCSSNLKRLAP